mgnify:CR=1 FL=1
MERTPTFTRPPPSPSRPDPAFAAILVLDVVGYSRHMAEDAEATLAAMGAAYRRIARPTVERADGRVVKLMGDGLLAEFADAAAAIHAAVQIQRAMTAGREPALARRPLELRAGVHAGEIWRRGGDIFGPTVNIAARLERAAQPGTILASFAAAADADCLRDVARHDLGAMWLHNIDRPVRVVRLDAVRR